MARVGAGVGVGLGVRAQEVGVGKPLLLVDACKELPASLSLLELIGKKFQRKLHQERELEAISKARKVLET